MQPVGAADDSIAMPIDLAEVEIRKTRRSIHHPLHPLEVDWKGTSGSVRLCIAAASLIRIYTNILKKAMLH